MRQRSARRNAGRFRLLTKCGVQGDHPPAGVWGRAPKPYAAAYFVSVASVRRTQETRFFPKPGVFQRPEAPGAMPGASACRFGLRAAVRRAHASPRRLWRGRETRKTEPAAHVGAARRRGQPVPRRRGMPSSNRKSGKGTGDSDFIRGLANLSNGFLDKRRAGCA